VVAKILVRVLAGLLLVPVVVYYAKQWSRRTSTTTLRVVAAVVAAVWAAEIALVLGLGPRTGVLAPFVVMAFLGLKFGLWAQVSTEEDTNRVGRLLLTAAVGVFAIAALLGAVPQ
jgi:integral membrane sensor domain MASE1